MIKTLWHCWKRQRTLKNYEQFGRPEMVRRYGKKKTYDSKQVESVWRDGGYDMLFICYAYADLLTRKDFDQLHRDLGESCDYLQMRGTLVDSGVDCWSSVFEGFGSSSTSFGSPTDSTSTFFHGGDHDTSDSGDWGGGDFGGGGDGGGD